MTSAKERRAASRAVLEGFKQRVPDPGAEPAPVPRTGPGLALHTVGVNSALQAKVDTLEAKVAEFEGAAPERLVDSNLIDDSEFANRHPDAFKSAEFLQLKEEIAGAGGNIQAIKVRRKANGRFEIIFGHRRARACRELGLPVLATIVEDMTDEALFIEMDRENRGRSDPSAWEQGAFYVKALERGLFPSQRQLAHKLGVDLSNAGKCIALAKLPAQVISAFASPLDIQLRWGGALAKAYEADREGVLTRAKEIAKQDPRPRPSTVFEVLTGKAGPTGPKAAASEVKIMDGDKTFGSIAIKGDRATVSLAPGVVSEKDSAELAELIKRWLLGRRRK